MVAKKSPARRMTDPPKSGSSIGKAVGKMVGSGSFAAALPKKDKPKKGGQRGSAPRLEEYPKRKGGGIAPPPKGPVGPDGQKPQRDVPKDYVPNWQPGPWKKDSPYAPPKPALPNPKKPSKPKSTPKPKSPSTTTTTVPGVAQTLPKKKK